MIVNSSLLVWLHVILGSLMFLSANISDNSYTINISNNICTCNEYHAFELDNVYNNCSVEIGGMLSVAATPIIVDRKGAMYSIEKDGTNITLSNKIFSRQYDSYVRRGNRIEVWPWINKDNAMTLCTPDYITLVKDDAIINEYRNIYSINSAVYQNNRYVCFGARYPSWEVYASMHDENFCINRRLNLTELFSIFDHDQPRLYRASIADKVTSINRLGSNTFILVNTVHDTVNSYTINYKIPESKNLKSINNGRILSTHATDDSVYILSVQDNECIIVSECNINSNTHIKSLVYNISSDFVSGYSIYVRDGTAYLYVLGINDDSKYYIHICKL